MKQALIFLFTLLAFVGCSTDNEDKQNDSNNIVGTWWLYESVDVTYNDTYDYRDQNRLLIFNSNGEYERSEEGISKDFGTYKQSGSQIKLYDYNGRKVTSVEITIRKIDSDYMELNWTYISSGEKDPQINRYKRKL